MSSWCIIDPLSHYVISLFIFFSLKHTLSDVNIVTAVIFDQYLHSLIFPIFLTFSVSLYLEVSRNSIQSVLLFYPFCHVVLIHKFRSCKFKIILDMSELKYTINFVFLLYYFLFSSSVCFLDAPHPSFGLYLTLFRILLDTSVMFLRIYVLIFFILDT